MAWFKCKANVRCNGKRYLRGAVVELDSDTAKLNDNFEPCASPVKAEAAAAEPAKAPKAEKTKEPPPEKVKDQPFGAGPAGAKSDK
jgi:hypothetical protein